MNMKDLEAVLSRMKKAQERWCLAEIVDDPEEMWEEYPKFLDWAIPILEKSICKYETLLKNYRRK